MEWNFLPQVLIQECLLYLDDFEQKYMLQKWLITDFLEACERQFLDFIVHFQHQLTNENLTSMIDILSKVGGFFILQWINNQYKAYSWSNYQIEKVYDIEMLFFLSKGCSWNERTYSLAASSGQLKVLQYLHNNGCPLVFFVMPFCSLFGTPGNFENIFILDLLWDTPWQLLMAI